MTLSKLRSNSSFESVRKQAKKLAKLVAENDADALARVLAQGQTLPLSLRDAQLVIAREYGFAGWQDLRTAVLRQEGSGLEWAAAEAERAIHDNKVDRLAELIAEYPTLITWRSDTGETLLGFATGAFGDSGTPEREETYTRRECAEFLLDAGAIADVGIWEGVIQVRAKRLLDLLTRKATPHRRLDILAALGDVEGVRECLSASPTEAESIGALYSACHFERRAVAALILDRCIELNPDLGAHIDAWRGRAGFIDYLIEHPETHGDPWQSIVVTELTRAMHENNLLEFTEWLRRESNVLDEALQIRLIEVSTYNDRGPFIERLLEFKPGLLSADPPPPSSSLGFALEYGNDHLTPLLTQIWPLPNDLPHAAGTGDFARVRGWFDEAGQPRLGSLSQHLPTNHPFTLGNLHWNPPNAQMVLNVALAWACVNHHFEIASFLLEHGADINTDWSTHEPASILHECAIHGDFEAAQFLIDHGIDLTIRDYRWDATAEGWARYAAKNEKMAEMLARAGKTR